LEAYADSKQIPNLLFFGPIGSGKKTIVTNFVHYLYQGNKELITTYSLWVNCAFGKGIKFIRETVKYFAKTNVNDGKLKIIVLHNADELTPDAQSALRRCIEDYSLTTRFILITVNKQGILKPILSRFAEIFVSPGENLHVNKAMKAFPTSVEERDRRKRLHQTLKSLKPDTCLTSLAEDLAAQAYSAKDLADYVESSNTESQLKYEWLMEYLKIKKNFRSEAFLLFVLLRTKVFRPDL
jgi:replication-associated recombination protein RarA